MFVNVLKIKRGFHITQCRLCCALVLALSLLPALPAHAQAAIKTGANVQTALVMSIEGGIGPATADFIQRGIDQAQAQQAHLLVLQLDTPGGLDKSMRSIVKSILASSVPVATYVYPSGARAASAGTYVLYASHIAAMAPGTNLGAATPVQMGGLPTSPNKPRDKQAPAKAPATAMEKKVINDATAYIQGLAQLRGRNANWAGQAVREAASVQAAQALKIGVIDVVADNLPDLLTQIDGRTVKMTQTGTEQVLTTRHLTPVFFKPDWRMRVLTTLTDPSVAYILLLLGIYGVFFEFLNPGFVVPGVIGGIALLLALYALQLLPMNYAGLGLIFLGVVFMVAEAFVSSFGALGIGGVIAFALGSFLLIEPGTAGWQIPWTMILTATLANLLFFMVMVGAVVRSRRKQVVIGVRALIGQHGVVLKEIAMHGTVRVNGEVWQATSDKRIAKDHQVRIVAVTGLVLTVEPMS